MQASDIHCTLQMPAVYFIAVTLARVIFLIRMPKARGLQAYIYMRQITRAHITAIT